MQLCLKDTFNVYLKADTETENFVRAVLGAHFSTVTPKVPKEPSLLHFSEEMLHQIGLSVADAKSDEFLSVFSGSSVYPNTKPFAMCYGGHQFGNWAGQLGDGRAINLFEVNFDQKQWALQLKGAGETPYSRRADGLAVLRSSIREYLCSEAMHHLGVPTTRALSLMLSGDYVERDMLYNGNPAFEKGAIVCRVAPSFVRFGNFQIFAARKDTENLKALTDYTITHFFEHLGKPNKESFLVFFSEVAQRTMQLMVEWERVGFVHGVMNTDNMSILGLTIDYGPYGWLEDYDPNWTPNTTDASHKRYRFGNQANVALWNVVQLANALVPLVEDVPVIQAILDELKVDFLENRQRMFHDKLGLEGNVPGFTLFLNELEELLFRSEMDYTIFYRNLGNFDENDVEGFLTSLSKVSYATSIADQEESWRNWLNKYVSILSTNGKQNRRSEMNATNPKYVLRNYMAQLAIDAANEGDYSVIDELFRLLKIPYDEQPENEKWFTKRPEWAKHKVGCSMLSCSS